MRSDTVVLPASMWAMMPKFRRAAMSATCWAWTFGSSFVSMRRSAGVSVRSRTRKRRRGPRSSPDAKVFGRGGGRASPQAARLPAAQAPSPWAGLASNAPPAAVAEPPAPRGGVSLAMDMDPAAPVPIERLLEHRGWVEALARTLVADANRADDLAQDAWLAALRHPPRHGDALKAWLARLVRHRASNARRGETRRGARERAAWGPPRSGDRADAVARIEAHERVVRAVLALTEPYRTTIVLRFYDGLSGPEIAERMGVPLDTVRTRTKRALAQLRDALMDDRDSLGLLPLVGGCAMKTGTKTGLVAAALVLAAGAGVWTWMRAAPGAPPAPPAEEVAAVPPAPKPAAAAPMPSPPSATAGVFGEVWRRAPESPAAGITVRLTSPGAADVTAVTDASGRFRFESLPPGKRGTLRAADGESLVEPVAVP